MNAPAFLIDTVDATGKGIVLAEWDLQAADRRTPLEAGALSTLIAQFTETFPWTRVAKLTATFTANDLTHKVELPGDDAVGQLKSCHTRYRCGGAELHLAMTLAWKDPERGVGKSEIEPAGTLLIYEAGADIICTLTLSINLFTDIVYLYKKSEAGFSAYAYDIAPTAWENRRVLAESLVQWQSTAGPIVSYGSDVLGEGDVGPQGIAASARVQ